MAKQKYSKEELLTNLFEVFRQCGYDGASMEVLAKATGLRKSSLYHRFPGGKEQMAQEVLQTVAQWIKTHVVAVAHLAIPVEEKLDKVMRHLFELYDGGKKSCILRSMSTESGLEKFGDLIRGTFQDLHDGFKSLALEFGKEEPEADKLAREAILKIQGSLVVGKGMGEPQLFQETLNGIEADFRR
ncbi:MAG: TetR/AcrR family transcriptional regulator [Cytophagales bacterium]|nr:TetR/AcrR family transcriptional regulator [Cytophagales bacterium]